LKLAGIRSLWKWLASHRSRKNFQVDPFFPDDRHFEHSGLHGRNRRRIRADRVDAPNSMPVTGIACEAYS